MATTLKQYETKRQNCPLSTKVEDSVSFNWGPTSAKVQHYQNQLLDIHACVG